MTDRERREATADLGAFLDRWQADRAAQTSATKPMNHPNLGPWTPPPTYPSPPLSPADMDDLDARLVAEPDAPTPDEVDYSERLIAAGLARVVAEYNHRRAVHEPLAGISEQAALALAESHRSGRVKSELLRCLESLEVAR